MEVSGQLHAPTALHPRTFYRLHIIDTAAIIPGNNVNRLIFIVNTQYVFCEVRPEILNII
jgi:hypothetical protein